MPAQVRSRGPHRGGLIRGWILSKQDGGKGLQRGRAVNRSSLSFVDHQLTEGKSVRGGGSHPPRKEMPGLGLGSQWPEAACRGLGSRAGETYE